MWCANYREEDRSWASVFPLFQVLLKYLSCICDKPQLTEKMPEDLRHIQRINAGEIGPAGTLAHGIGSHWRIWPHHLALFFHLPALKFLRYTGLLDWREEAK